MSFGPSILRRFHTILRYPLVYGAFQRSVGRVSVHTRYVAEYIRPSRGDRVLDIGCGPAHILEHLPGVEYVGMDGSEAYIKAARERFGDRGQFIHSPVGAASVDRPGTYDLVLATAILHHLDDAECLALFRLAKTALKPGGRLVTLDGCYQKGQSPIAKLMLWLDRGRFVRERDGYVALAEQFFTRVQAHIHHDLLRIPYTHIILECEA